MHHEIKGLIEGKAPDRSGIDLSKPAPLADHVLQAAYSKFGKKHWLGVQAVLLHEGSRQRFQRYRWIHMRVTRAADVAWKWQARLRPIGDGPRLGRRGQRIFGTPRILPCSAARVAERAN